MATAVTDKPDWPDFMVGTVRHQRTVQVKPYESETFSHEVQYLIDPLADPSTNIASGRQAAIEAKEVTYRMLGLAAELDDDGIPMEILEDGFPGATVEDEGPTAGGVTQSSVPASPPHDPNSLPKRRSDMNDIQKAQAAANVEWAKKRYETHPHEFYDNRFDKRTANSPDFKHKSTGIAFWLD